MIPLSWAVRKMTQSIQSLQKALEVIDELACAGEPVGVSDLSRRLNLTKNQIFRVLKTLEQYDYVHQVDSKCYQLGFKFFEIGQQILDQTDLSHIAIPYMDELRNATGESVHLVVRDGFQGVCIARRESGALIRMSARVGRRYLLHAGACAKAILAFQPQYVFDAAVERYGLPAYTEHTVTDREALACHLAEIRRQGYAESDEDLDVNAYAVAVPIYDRTGRVNAAMSIAGPVQRFSSDDRISALSLLSDACDRISAALGAVKRPSAGITFGSWSEGTNGTGRGDTHIEEVTQVVRAQVKSSSS